MAQTISAIYGARKSAGLADDAARDVYFGAVGKRSLRDMTPGEQVRVLQAINRLPKTSERKKLEGPYAAKIIALWLDGWNLGVFADRRDASLLAFVKRQAKVDHTRFLIAAADAQAVIEALKKWITREAGVVWGEHADLMDDVIAAQVAILELGARDLLGERGEMLDAFAAWRKDEAGRSDKIRMMKLFGEAIREEKAARR